MNLYDQYKTTLGDGHVILTERNKHFLICPGDVVSKYDGQTHYIGVRQLMSLYGVRAEECVTDGPHNRRLEGLLHLEPNYDGDYSLPDVMSDPCEPYQPVSDSICCALVVGACNFLFHVIPL